MGRTRDELFAEELVVFGGGDLAHGKCLAGLERRVVGPDGLQETAVDKPVERLTRDPLGKFLQNDEVEIAVSVLAVGPRDRKYFVPDAVGE